MKEIIIDTWYGIAAVGTIAATMFILVAFMKMVDMTPDAIRLAIATPLFVYFCWAFGGLTRSMMNRD
jgi:hypothetical protein